jgi:DNA-binding transcriptional MerR regulator
MLSVMDSEMRIGQAADRLNVSKGYLRRLERQRRIPPARRDAFGDRVYTELDVMLLWLLGIGSGRHLKRAEEVLKGSR